MRIRILLTVFLFVSLIAGAFAQGNLQFNQVRKIQWSRTTPPSASSLFHVMGPFVVNVPVGKVLKIESMNVSILRAAQFSGTQTALSGGGNSGAGIYLEETLVYSNHSASNEMVSESHSIIWLPEGDHNFYIGGYAIGGSTQTYSAIFTALEFNVLP